MNEALAALQHHVTGAIERGESTAIVGIPARTKRPLYREIASILQAIKNCEKAGNAEWFDKHHERLTKLIDLLPSGSGIDHGTRIEESACKAEKLVFTLGFHHMNENGMYDGWTEHTLTVTPSFDGIDMRFSGRNRNDIKDYLHDTYYFALTQEVEIG